MYNGISAEKFAVALAANTTATSYASSAPTATLPATGTDNCVITLKNAAGGGIVPPNLMVMAFGAGNDNSTLVFQVLGWTQVSGLGLWVSQVLAEYTATLSAAVGVASYVPVNTDRLADGYALVANQGVDAQGTTKVSPANDTPGSVTISTKGCQLIQINFKTGSSATNCNALYRLF